MSSNPPKSRIVRTVEYDKDELWTRFQWGLLIGVLVAAPTACWLGSVLGRLFQ